MTKAEIVCRILNIEFTSGSTFDSKTEIRSLVLNLVKSIYDLEIIFLKTEDAIFDPIKVVTLRISLSTSNLIKVAAIMIIIKTIDI